MFQKRTSLKPGFSHSANAPPTPSASGYMHGKVPSCTANVYNRKDGSGQFVRVRHEIATKPGAIEYEQVLDPARDTGVKVEGGVLVTYPSIPEDTVVTLRVAPESIREYKGKVRINRAEREARPRRLLLVYYA